MMWYIHDVKYDKSTLLPILLGLDPEHGCPGITPSAGVMRDWGALMAAACVSIVLQSNELWLRVNC